MSETTPPARRMGMEDYSTHLAHLCFAILELIPTDENTDWDVHDAAIAYCNFKLFFDELGTIEAFYGRDYRTVN